MRRVPLIASLVVSLAGVLAAHLGAHLQTAAILTPGQIATYNRLRGYEAARFTGRSIESERT